ncbi:hypothetical protein CC86DRAFT_132929 [Ophiobolus disseminans]|uniref:Uncharacterized protein n=1 Tax=Ophiobolus disseminans TaxID=1469910 RepID=A0A6A7ACA6_9PLEO|nr:hypothetical protein CC86DRAFT_132929 [Ophiobolus disseminans]
MLMFCSQVFTFSPFTRTSQNEHSSTHDSVFRQHIPYLWPRGMLVQRMQKISIDNFASIFTDDSAHQLLYPIIEFSRKHLHIQIDVLLSYWHYDGQFSPLLFLRKGLILEGLFGGANVSIPFREDDDAVFRLLTSKPRALFHFTSLHIKPREGSTYNSIAFGRRLDAAFKVRIRIN